MDIARYKGYHEVVEVFQCHGTEVDVPDEVSDMSCIHVLFYKYWHVHILNIIVYTTKV